MDDGDKVLCVDDDSLILEFCRAMHKHLHSQGRNYVLETAQSPERALEMVASQGPFAVVVSDLQMPGMNGIQLLRAIKDRSPDTVCMMLTGGGSLQVAIDALNQGSVYRFLTKPITIQTFDSAVEACREHFRLVRAEKDLLEKTLMGSIEVVTGMLALANPTAYGRAARVRQRAKQLAQKLKMQNVWQVEIAAMLSQAGCIALPEQTLTRFYRGEVHAAHELKMLADHPRVGHDLIAHLPRLEPVARAIAYQEKHYDGSGMPRDEIAGDHIPIAARILKIAFDLETLLARGMSTMDALQTMRKRGGWYDPAVLDVLQAALQSEAKMQLKQVSVQWLMEEMERLRTHPSLDRILLAEDVMTTGNLLILSKGHELTLSLLERLRNFARHAGIREPIQVLVGKGDEPQAA